MRTPKYRRHSTRDIAFVEWKGARHYLPGPYKSPESWAAYLHFLKEHCGLVEPKPLVLKPGTQLTVTMMVVAYLDYAEGYYPQGNRSEYANVRQAVKRLKAACGSSGANVVGPLVLKKIQQQLIDEGRSRSYINGTLAKIKRCFKWAASEELIPISVYQGVATVSGLRAGRTAAREPKPKDPIPWEWVAPIFRHLPPTLAAMLRLQWYTGVRSDSLCEAKLEQFNLSDGMWLWRPKHKTSWLGRELVIPIGPRARGAIGDILHHRKPGEYLFRPCDVRRCRTYGEQYKSGSYRQAIQRAIHKENRRRRKLCEAPDLLPIWSPHGLRHSKGHAIRAAYGVEAAQAILGHDSLDATQLYSERRLALAKEIALATG